MLFRSETARAFIGEMQGSQEERVAYHGDLISYLRLNAQIIEPREFARDVFPVAEQDAFLAKCREVGIGSAFTKQLDLVKTKLRRQSIRFSSSVTLYAPADVFRDAVKITGIDEEGWTSLRIRGSIESMP